MEFARELKISRTPVREAILVLESQGLVEQVPRFGAFVRVLRRRELKGLWRVRHALECAAAADAAKRATAKEIAKLKRNCREKVRICKMLRDAKVGEGPLPADEPTNDADFHLLLMKASGNPWVIELVSNMGMLALLMANRSKLPSTTLSREFAQSCIEHWRIAQAVARHDPRAARAAMSRHLRNGARNTLAHYDWVKRQERETGRKAEDNLPAAMRNLAALRVRESSARSISKSRAARSRRDA